MSKAQAMLTDRPVSLARARVQEDARPPAARSRRGPLWRWVRQAEVPATRVWRPWWGLGLVEVVTHPYARYRASRALFVPGMRASCGLPARPAMLVPL